MTNEANEANEAKQITPRVILESVKPHGNFELHLETDAVNPFNRMYIIRAKHPPYKELAILGSEIAAISAFFTWDEGFRITTDEK